METLVAVLAVLASLLLGAVIGVSAYAYLLRRKFPDEGVPLLTQQSAVERL